MAANIEGGKRTSSSGVSAALNKQGQRTSSSGAAQKMKGGKC